MIAIQSLGRTTGASNSSSYVWQVSWLDYLGANSFSTFEGGPADVTAVCCQAPFPCHRQVPLNKHKQYRWRKASDLHDLYAHHLEWPAAADCLYAKSQYRGRPLCTAFKYTEGKIVVALFSDLALAAGQMLPRLSLIIASHELQISMMSQEGRRARGADFWK